MGYACPVCEDPQADAGHLANHLAFTALLRAGDHESWLDEHVPDWRERDEDGLADAVAAMADDADYPQVFEDTTADGGHGDHAHGHDDHDHSEGVHNHGEGTPGGDPLDAPPSAFGVDPDPEAQQDVLREAMELTRERRDDADGEGNGANDEADDAADSETE